MRSANLRRVSRWVLGLASPAAEQHARSKGAVVGGSKMGSQHGLVNGTH